MDEIESTAVKRVKLCIDPGHGMGNVRPGVFDPGAVWEDPASENYVREADVTLAWGITLAWYFKNAGIPYAMTRDDNIDPDPIGKRDDFAVKHNCTHMLSIHCNYYTVPTANGTENYYRTESDLRFAREIQFVAVSQLGLTDRGCKKEASSQHSKLSVLDFPGPGCLWEIGFLSNKSDRNVMIFRQSRILFAETMVKYFKELQAG